MKKLMTGCVAAGAALSAGVAGAQETGAEPGMGEKLSEYGAAAGDKIDALVGSPEAAEAAGSIVEWIGAVHALYHPLINWVLVAVGVSLFVSHGGQLVFGKIWVGLRHGGWDWGEILNDLLVGAFAALALPAVLVIPAGHGAFISSPLAVLSSAAVGMLIGVFLYGHGVKQEALAAKAKQAEKAAGA